jgi:hypothetical protein
VAILMPDPVCSKNAPESNPKRKPMKRIQKKLNKMQRQVRSSRKTATNAEVLAERLRRSKQAFSVLLDHGAVAKMTFVEQKYYRDRALLFAQHSFDQTFGVSRFSEIEKVRAEWKKKEETAAKVEMVEAAVKAEAQDNVAESEEAAHEHTADCKHEEISNG